LGSLPKEFDIVKSALGDYTDEQNTAVGAIITFGEKAGGVLEQAITSKSGDPRFLGAIFRERLEETLKNANIPPEQIAEYIGLAGLDEATIDLAVKISLAEEERIKFETILALFQQDLNDAPPELRLAVADAIRDDEFAKANVLIELMNGQLTPAEIQFVLGVLPELAPYIAQLQAEADADAIALTTALFPPGTMIGDLMANLQAQANAAPPVVIPIVLPNNATTGNFNVDVSRATKGGGFGKAAGGSVFPTTTYSVNENGRELFTPSSNGFIMNASNAQALLEGVSQLVNKGGGGMTNITINETSSPRQTALEVIRANKASLFLAGAL
jgi:hypothetical protein